MGRPSDFTQETLDAICALLSQGKSLVAVCAADDMPSARTVQNWMNGSEDVLSQITRAREIGYQFRADQAVEDAKAAKDAALARLAFDAERWYLGKLSNAFSDDKARKLEVNSKVTHAYDLDSLSDGEIDQLERILANAGAGASGESPPPPDRLH